MKQYKSFLKEKQFKEEKRELFSRSWSTVFSFLLLIFFMKFSDIYFSKIIEILKQSIDPRSWNKMLFISFSDLLLILSPFVSFWVMHFLFQHFTKGFHFKKSFFKPIKLKLENKEKLISLLFQWILFMILVVILINYLLSLELGLFATSSIEDQITFVKTSIFYILIFFLGMSFLSSALDQICSYYEYQKDLLVSYYEARREMKEAGRWSFIKNKMRNRK